MITKDTTIEELINEFPLTVSLLSDKGIRCIVCGEPIWGSLEEAAREKGWNNLQINNLIDELNSILK